MSEGAGAGAGQCSRALHVQCPSFSPWTDNRRTKRHRLRRHDLTSDLVAAVSLGKVVRTLDSAGETRSLQMFSLSYLPTIPTDGTSLFFQLWTRPCTASLLREFQLIHAAFGIEKKILSFPASKTASRNPLVIPPSSLGRVLCNSAILSS